MITPQEEILAAFYRDRRLAHRVLFPHKHKTPEYVDLMIDDFHFCPTPYLLTEAFRGGAKSTIAEEGVSVKAGMREFKNMLLLGSSSDRACERLSAIKRIIEANEDFIDVFGRLRGPTWTEDEIELSTGARILALGRGQAILGIKHFEDRPDFFVADDIEDRESVRTEEGRAKAHRWLMADVIPACDPDARGIVLATQRDPEDIVGKIKMDARADGSLWTIRKYPIKFKDEQGIEQPTWPERFPLKRIERIQGGLERQGLGREFRIEYMCEATAAEDKTFLPEMLRVEPRVRTWQAVYSMHDPARTVGANSASTGFAAWSYIGPKIVVWDAWARMLMPNEIVDSLFDVHDEHHPVMVGFEMDGLNEWAMQNIRQEQLRRRIMLPIKGVLAPKGKMDFIRGLQPFAKARELEFAKELPDLRAQLLNFPSGRIDAPNALAYALKLRPGAPMYEDFTVQHIGEDLQPSKGHPLWLVWNAGSSGVTAALVQMFEGWLRVYADWVREGDLHGTVADIVREASIEAGRGFRHICPPVHFDRYNNVGLVQAANRVPIELRSGTDPSRGAGELRTLLEKQVRGFPGLMVSSRAGWVLNGLSGGYCRALSKQGILADYAEEGIYRTMMEGIESFAGLMTLGTESDDPRNYRYREDGSRYVSTMRAR
jgi:hypothetical protein